MAKDEAESSESRRKTVVWIARYSQILTFLFAQAISVVACISLFLLLSGGGPLQEADATEMIVMVAVGFLLLVSSVIYMVVMVRVTFLRALQRYQCSDDAPVLPIRVDQPLSGPLESLLLSFTSATHKTQAFFFTSATINLSLIYFDESWFHLFLAFMSVFSIVWLTPTVGRLARFVQRGLDMKQQTQASS
jgi:hypothetical protein